MSLLKSISLLMRETVHEWIEDGGANIAAALAYYAIFSLSPLLIIVSITLGLVMDPNTLETNLVSNVQATVGQQAAELIRSLMRSSGRTTDVIGTLVWLGIVVWGASGMFAQLQNALNKIWEVKARPGRSPLVLVKSRFQSFGIVVITALALLGTMLINAALNSSIDNSSAALAEMKSVGSVLQVSRLFGRCWSRSPSPPG
jgi:membrane protein